MAPRHQPPKSTGDYSSEDFEDFFRPKLPRGRTPRGMGRRLGFLAQVGCLTTRKPLPPAGRGGRRGRGAVRPECSRYAQRVIVKARVVRGRAGKALREHLNYLQRDGVGIDGKEPQVFTGKRDLAPEEVLEWGKGLSGDRHHFRFIVSPEKASDLDLRRYTRDLVKQIERDLRTQLDWIAVSHHNTDNPHVHIVLRGVDQRGKDLVLSRDYISRGIRINARELATRELGLLTDLDLQREEQRSLTQNRYTAVDRGLERDAAAHEQHLIDLRGPAPKGCNFAKLNLRNKQVRLEYLKALGFAQEVGAGVWKLADDMKEKLRSLGVRNDIIKTLHDKARTGDITSGCGLTIFDKDNPPTKRIYGKVIHRGYADEISDSKCLVMAADDGRAYYVRKRSFCPVLP